MRVWRLLTSAALIVCACCAASGQQPDAGLTISGTVVDTHDRPVVDVSVRLVKTGFFELPTLLAEDFTSQQGAFTLQGLLPNDLSTANRANRPYMVAQAPDGRLGWLTVRGSHMYTGSRIKLVEVVDFRGKIADRDGKPLAKARITPQWLDQASIHHAESGDRLQFLPEVAEELGAETDDDGSFVLRNMPKQGSLCAIAAAAGYSAPRLRFDLDQPVNLRLDRGATLLGKVTCEADPPLAANVWVSLKSRSDPATVRTAGFKIADFDYRLTSQAGRFAFDALHPGKYLLEANLHPGGEYYSPSPQELTLVAGQEIVGLELPLRRAVRVRGLVVDRLTQEPLANAAVSVGHVNTSGARTAWTTGRTDAAGRYALYVSPGTIYVRVLESLSTHLASDVLNPKFVALDVADNTPEVEHPTIELERATSLRGLVVDGMGRPVAGAEVWTMNYPVAPRLPVVSDQQGRFQVSRLNAEQKVVARVRVPAAVATSDGTDAIDLKNLSEPLRIMVSKGNAWLISGRVIDSAGRALEGADVFVRWHGRYPGVGTEFKLNIQILQTRQDGSFRTAPLWPEDEFSIRVVAAGHQPVETPLIRGVGGKSVELDVLQMTPMVEPK